MQNYLHFKFLHTKWATKLKWGYKSNCILNSKHFAPHSLNLMNCAILMHF